MIKGIDNGKFVLCIPRGCGLNDILYQLWLSLEYCHKYNRILLIDTRLSGLWDDFSNYMIPKEQNAGIVGQVSDQCFQWFNALTCYPNQHEGELDFIYYDFHVRQHILGYQHTNLRRFMYIIQSLRLNIKGTENPLKRKFLFIRDSIERRKTSIIPLALDERPEDLVVHFQSGGGPESFEALKFFKFTDELQILLNVAISNCGDEYYAVHVRNTDYRTAYKPFFKNIKDSVCNKRLLICSDDQKVIDFAKRFFNDTHVFTVTETINPDGKPVHKSGWNKSNETRKRLNYNMFIDLICMANSDRLFISTLEDGNYSGFSLLAKKLHKDRDVMARLFNN